MMRRLIPLAALFASLAVAAPAAAEEGEYGRLYLGPRLGPALGISGPRGGYLAGLELSYRTPRYFYYNLELGFLHLLPRTITVAATSQTELDGTETVVAPEHDVTVTGLYGIPLTLEIGLRIAAGRVLLRAGVGFGAMLTFQTAETQGIDVSEMIMSFCFRPGIGLDVAFNDDEGLLRIDLAYLWQDAEFEITGSGDDVSSLLLTIGYSWMIVQ
jgi:hypothetical protein